ncbi:MAG TPA: polyprenyl synthetase family protein, partial [Bacteroidales bacterium]|nr:polyprenyl synthetase family protein [Bacteroidales bacterium]
LSGDAMCILAYHLLAQIAPEKLVLILPIFNETALKVCEGQQYDMNFESTRSVTESEYLKMIELKTATLLAACLQIGALMGGATSDEAQKLYRFGIHLGLAFQLQDDLLDTFGDENLLGKEIGKDIAANKKTYLLIKALQNASPQQRSELQQWITSPNSQVNDKIKTVKSIFLALEVDKLTQQLIDYHLNTAIELLEALPVASTRKEGLYSILDKLNHRRF